MLSSAGGEDGGTKVVGVLDTLIRAVIPFPLRGAEGVGSGSSYGLFLRLLARVNGLIRVYLFENSARVFEFALGRRFAGCSSPGDPPAKRFKR